VNPSDKALERAIRALENGKTELAIKIMCREIDRLIKTKRVPKGLARQVRNDFAGFVGLWDQLKASPLKEQ
jgi:hypothetical protein